MKMADMGNRVSVVVLLKMFVVAGLMLVMTHATPALANGTTTASFRADSYEFSVNENAAANAVVGTVAATDPDGDSLTYSVGGTDAANFNEVFALNTSTGEITVKPGASINYESGKTSYWVKVMVTDGKDDSGVAQSEPTPDATVPVIIRIVNVDEPGIVTLSTSSPRVGVELRATLYDPDGRMGGIFRSFWSRANSATGPFFLSPAELNENNRRLTYTPKEVDQYKYLKFTVYYLDSTCPLVYSSYQRCLKTAEVASDNVVADEEGLIIQRQVSNTPATGEVRTSGNPQVGHELYASAHNVRDENGAQSLYNRLTRFRWQWFRIDPVTEAEENVPGYRSWFWTYVVKNADRGKGIQARVSFLDDQGNTETLRGAIQWVPAPANNVATGSPVITGTAQVGETLSADPSGISDADGIVTSMLTYLWIANDGTEDTAIEGATSSTYTLVADDEGKTVTVQVIFIDRFGYTEVLTSAPTATVTGGTNNVQSNSAVTPPNSPATGSPGITGSLRFGQEFTATTTGISDNDGMTKATFTYQWIRHDLETFTDEDIAGAKGSTYTVTAEDNGKAIKVRVSFTDDAGNQESLTSNAVAASPPLVIPDEEVQDEEETTALTATILGAPESHDGTTAFTFELRFSESPKDSFSYRTLWDHAFTVTGGEVTKARRMAPNSDTPNIHWEITVRPSGNGAVTVELPVTTDCPSQGAICTEDGRKLSAALELVIPGPSSQQVSQENSPATGAPTISGTAQVGETLTASTTGISDAEGLSNVTFSYQWLADAAEISGATGSSYTLVAADQGKVIKVRVSFTDDAGNAESLTSAATAAVAAAPSPLTASIHSPPASHDGSAVFTFELRFSEEPASGFSYTTLKDHAFTVTGGTVTEVRRLEPPGNVRWEITVEPSSDADATIALPVTTDCAAQGAICTSDGRKLSNRLELTVSGPVADSHSPPPPLAASIHSPPASHDGSSVFTFELRFSETPKDDFSYTTLQDHALTVTGGTVTKARRLEPPGNVKWEITVRPSSDADVTIVLPVTTDCAAQGAICTSDGRMLSNRLEITISGPSG